MRQNIRIYYVDLFGCLHLPLKLKVPEITNQIAKQVNEKTYFQYCLILVINSCKDSIAISLSRSSML